MGVNKIVKKKICLLGSFGVGKTSLVRRYVYDLFDDQYLSTIGVKVIQKLLPPDSETGIQISFLIWDMEGFDQSSGITENYYTGAAGAIVVADLTRLKTIENIPENIHLFQKVNPKAKMLFAGNKNDLVQIQPAVKRSFVKLANDQNIPFYFTSALSGENVENCFITLSKHLIEYS